MIFCFGSCQLDDQRRELRRDSQILAMPPKEFELLLFLIRHRDRVVTKDELLDAIWPDVVVSESSLTRAISSIRRAIGGSRRSNPAITTHPRVGYRFGVPVVIEDGDDSAQVESVGEVDETVDRRPAAVLLLDIVGFSRHMAKSEERTIRILSLMRQLIAELAQENSGCVVNAVGDSVLVEFPDVASAIRCAQRIQQSSASRNQGLPEQEQLWFRAGVNAGDVFTDGDQIYGDVVNVAARIQALGDPGGLSISEAALDQIEQAEFELEWFDTGEQRLKNIPRLVRVLHARGIFPAVRRRAISLSLGPFSVESIAPRGAFSLHGRDQELSRLRQLWEESAAGQRQVVFLGGEPGVGKTRLGFEFATEVKAACNALFGRCDDDLGVPFQPFTEALRHFAAQLGAEGSEEWPTDGGGELLRLVPELRHSFPGLSGPSEADASTEQYRLFEAYSAWLVALSLQRPLLLLLDDLQWATPPTVQLLRHIIQVTPSSALMVIAGYRDTEITSATPLFELLADLRGEASVHRVDLPGLSVPAVESILGEATGADWGDQRARAESLVQRTNGNALFVGEIARFYSESPEASRSDTSIDASNTSPGIAEIVERRLSSLPTAAVDLLPVAAVLGLDFEADVLSVVVEREDGELLDLLAEIVRARLVDETGVGRYRFAHGLVRETLYGQLGVTRRARLHLAVARAIEVQRPQDSDQKTRDLAHHYSRAAPLGDPRDAISYAVRAAEGASSSLAYAEACSFYEKALTLVDAERAARRSERLRLLVGLGEVQRDAGDPGYRQTLLDAARQAEQEGNAEILGRAALANSRGYVSLLGAVDNERVAMLESALRLGDATDRVTQVRLKASLLVELTYTADRERLDRLGVEVLRDSRALNDASVEVEALRASYLAMWTPETLVARRRNAQRHRALAERLDTLDERWWVATWEAYPALESGDIETFDECLAEMVELAAQMNRPGPRWVLARRRAVRALVANRPDEAEAFALESLAAGRSMGQPDVELYYSTQMFGVRRAQGKLQECSELLESLERHPSASTRVMSATIRWAQGQVENAREALASEANGGFLQVPRIGGWLTTMTNYAWLAARLGDCDAAERLYDLLAPWGDQVVVDWVSFNGPVADLLGQLATVMGREQDAAIHFEDSRRATRQLRGQP